MHKRVIGAAFAIIVGSLVVAAYLLSQRDREPQSLLLGRWTRAELTPCSATYPLRVEFSEETYWTDGLSPWWRGGAYEVQNDQIRMITADGAAVYTVALSENRVAFTNTFGCTFSYLREAAGNNN
jgi:hypothetical protein